MTASQAPSLESAAWAYLPTGTLAGSPVASRPCAPSRASRSTPGVSAMSPGWLAGATSTRRLPSGLVRLSGTMRLRC